MLIEVAKRNELASGGIKSITINNREIIICKLEGEILALDRRCGHMNAPLEMGTLEGHILTCPMHYIQFDVNTGEALTKPLFHHSEEEKLDNSVKWVMELLSHVKTCNISTYPVMLEGDAIKIEI